MPIPPNPQMPMSNVNSLFTTIVNNTPNTLNVVIGTPDSTQLISLSSATLGPAGSNQNSVTVMSQYNSDNTVDVSIWEPGYSQSASVASFVSHQKDQSRILGPSLPWVDTINFVGGYTLQGPVQVQPGRLTMNVGFNSASK